MRLAVTVLVLAGCSATPAVRPGLPSNVAAVSDGGRNERAVATLRALSAALRAGQALDAVIDPAGAWVWHQPGCCISPWFQLEAGQRVADRLGRVGLYATRVGNYEAQFATAIDRGLDQLEVDPVALTPRVHVVDCGDDAMATTRGFLITHDVDLARDRPAWAERTPRAPMAFRFQFGSVAVYLAETGRSVTVTHLLLWFPCDA
jgi:hypothetical protein